MAHNISFVSGRAEMFYYGDRPWHGLGTPVEHTLTAEEALAAASLDWQVEKKQIYFQNKTGIYTEAKGFAVVRTDYQVPLGIVSDKYIPVQNRESFDFLDDLVMTREAKYHTAGAINNGAKVWLLAKLPEKIVVLEDDVVEQYLLLVNSHDGKSCLKVLFTPTRVVCQNTLNLALTQAQVSVNIAHRGDVKSKKFEAQRVLGIAMTHFKDVENAYKNFASHQITATDLKKYIADVIPGESKAILTMREKIEELHEVGAGAEMTRGTLWGAYNAVAEFVDHHRIKNYEQNPDRYFEYVNFGSGASIKTKAFEEAVKYSYS